MRILTFNYEFPPLGGGGGVVFEQIVEQLAQRHEVSVITSGYADLPRLEQRGRLRIHRVPVVGRRALATASLPSMLSYWPASRRYGARLLSEQRFDVINSHFVVPSAPSADGLARRFGLPHVLSIHGGDIFDPSKRLSPHRLPMVRSLVTRLLRRADRVVAQSQNTADNARRFYKPKREIDIIPLGIPRRTVDTPSRADLDLPEDRFVMVTVGRLVERKKIDQLIRIVARRDAARDLLVIVGDGPKRGQLQALVQSMGLGERVHFAGRVTETRKHELLAAADVFASTSEHEGFGLVFLEAMDRGLPVVAYDHGGQTDFLRDGVTGGLVRLGDADGFAAALNRLADDPAYRQRCGAHNRQAVAAYYIERCGERYEALFQEILGSQATVSCNAM